MLLCALASCPEIADESDNEQTQGKMWHISFGFFILFCRHFEIYHSPKSAHTHTQCILIVSSFCRRCILFLNSMPNCKIRQQLFHLAHSWSCSPLLLLLFFAWQCLFEEFLFLVNQRCFLPFRGSSRKTNKYCNSLNTCVQFYGHLSIQIWMDLMKKVLSIRMSECHSIEYADCFVILH